MDDESIHLERVHQLVEEKKFESAKAELLMALKCKIDVFLKSVSAMEINTRLTHYSSIGTIHSILQGHIKNHIQEKQKHKEEKERCDEGYLRLYDASSLNDPTEGEYLKTHLAKEHEWLDTARQDTDAFICSFVSGKNKKEMGDVNIYWQSYGNDGLGCSITPVINHSYMGKFKSVLYGEQGTEIIKQQFKDYFKFGRKIYGEVHDKESFATEFWKGFDKVKFLYKHEGYLGEKEFRCIKISNPNEKLNIKYHIKDEIPSIRRHTTVPYLKAGEILTSDSKIVIGPRVENGDRWCKYLEELARESNLMGTVFTCSNIPYRKKL